MELLFFSLAKLGTRGMERNLWDIEMAKTDCIKYYDRIRRD